MTLTGAVVDISRSSFIWALLALMLLVSCRSIKPIREAEFENFESSKVDPAQITRQMPGTASPLRSVEGEGKALISTPDRSDRATLTFAGNKDTSYISIKNRIGIHGGEMMATADSILIYDKIEQKAHKISIQEAHSTQISSLASTNLVEVLDYRISPDQVEKVYSNPQYYLLILVDKTQVRISRETYNIMSVKLPAGAEAPYNRIQYESYAMNKEYSLPQKITITSADQRSRVTLLIQSLSVNPPSPNLTIDLPDKISVQRL